MRTPNETGRFPRRGLIASAGAGAAAVLGAPAPEQEASSLSWVRTAYREVFTDTGGGPARPTAPTSTIPTPILAICAGTPRGRSALEHLGGDLRWNTSGVPWHDLYYGENHPRPQRVKQAWDPADVFRHRQSVRLPGR
ncbi:BBE domain-containing protein [Streptomyces sp. A0958]|uniref:BBE domain-containing protein n=1 Tax=Streptomyces sp. A0958 TaxID=2563101 RepID=UPI001445AA4C|nr:BBE domain-containing protein [Streptomyces sp. A0958]